jgi:hypothetical protein
MLELPAIVWRITMLSFGQIVVGVLSHWWSMSAASCTSPRHFPPILQLLEYPTQLVSEVVASLPVGRQHMQPKLSVEQSETSQLVHYFEHK